jgi:hypothetical protein
MGSLGPQKKLRSFLWYVIDCSQGPTGKKTGYLDETLVKISNHIGFGWAIDLSSSRWCE